MDAPTRQSVPPRWEHWRVSASERTRDQNAALGLRVRVAELVDELRDAIDAGCDAGTLDEIVAMWEADVADLTFDALVAEGSPTPCADCKMDVAPNGNDGRPIEGRWEWFMVQDRVWSDACVNGGDARYLCISCLEQRIGRRLNRADFTDALANTALSGLESERLCARLVS